MLALASIIERLRQRCGTAFRQYGGAAEFAALPDNGPNVVPAAFVVPLNETPGPNQLETGIMQRVSCQFGVILAVRNLRDGVGGAANDELGPLRRQVKDALLGWIAPGCDDVITLGPGRVLQLNNQVLWYQDDFMTAYYERMV